MEEATSPGFFSNLLQHPLVAYGLVTVACVIMTLAGVLIKVMTDVDPFLLSAVRDCVIFLCSMPRLIWYNIDVVPREGRKIKFLFARASLTVFYTMSLFYSFRYMPIGDARTITSTNPIFTAIFAWCVLKEPFGLFEVSMLASTVTGMVFVLHPPAIFGEEGDASTAYDNTYTYAAIFASVGTVFQALGVVATRAIKYVPRELLSFIVLFINFLIAFNSLI